MKNKQIITLIGTTVAGVSVFGLAVGLATTVRYNSEDPKKAVIAFAESVANVSFNTKAFPIDASYESIKKQIFSQGGPEADKGVDFSKILTFYEKSNTDNTDTTNGASEFKAIKNGTNLDPHFVVDSFTFDDSTKTFKVDYHVEQTLTNNHNVISGKYTKTIAIAQRMKFFLADVVEDAKTSFTKLSANSLTDFQSATDKNLVKVPEISRAIDFKDYVNQANDSQEAINLIDSYFKNFNDILNNFTNSTKNALPNKAPLYSFKLVRNPLTNNYIDIDDHGIARFYLQTNLSSIAKRDLTNLNGVKLSYVDSIQIANTSGQQVASFFTSAQNILNNIDLAAAKAQSNNNRKTTLSAQTSSTTKNGNTVTANSQNTKQDASQITAFDFLSKLQRNLSFYSTLESRQNYIKETVDSYLQNGLSFVFSGDLDAFHTSGAFQATDSSDQITGLSYTFLDKNISVTPSARDGFEVSLPVKIELKNSFFGVDNNDTVVASKEIIFNLTGFKTNSEVSSKDQVSLPFKPQASGDGTTSQTNELLLLPDQQKRYVYNLDPSPYSRFVYGLEPYMSGTVQPASVTTQQTSTAAPVPTTKAAVGSGSGPTTSQPDAEEVQFNKLTNEEKQLVNTLTANAWGHFVKSFKPASSSEIQALVDSRKNEELYKLFSNRAGYGYDFGTTNAYVNAWTGKDRFPSIEEISQFSKDETQFAKDSYIDSLDTTEFFSKPADVAAFYANLAQEGPLAVVSYLLPLAKAWGIVDSNVDVTEKIEEFQNSKDNIFAQAFKIKSNSSVGTETKILSFNKQYLNLHNQGFYSSLLLPKKPYELIKTAFGASDTAQNITKTDLNILSAIKSSKETLSLIDKNDFEESGFLKKDSTNTQTNAYQQSGDFQGFKSFGDVLIAFYIKALQFDNFAPFSAIDSKLIAKPTFANFKSSVDAEITKKLFENQMNDGDPYASIDYYYTFGYPNDKGEIDQPLFITPTKTIIFNLSTATSKEFKLSALDKAVISLPIYYQNATIDNFNAQFFKQGMTQTSDNHGDNQQQWLDDSNLHILANTLGQQGKDLEAYVATHYPNYKIMVSSKVDTDTFDSNKKVITLALQEITPKTSTTVENAPQQQGNQDTPGAKGASGVRETQTPPPAPQGRANDDDEDGSYGKVTPTPVKPQMSTVVYKIYVSLKPTVQEPRATNTLDSTSTTPPTQSPTVKAQQ